jgi:hypothetical protein
VEEIKAESSRIISKPPQITFKTDVVSPPNTIYFSDKDRLNLNWRANISTGIIQYYLRILKPDGTIAEINGQQSTLTAYTGQSVQIPATEGFLISATLEANNFGVVGCAAVSITITRIGFTAADNIAVLLRGLLVVGQVLTFPYGIQRSALEGPGLLRAVSGTDPAAGAEINELVPSQARWRLMGLTAVLVTDATVAARVPTLSFDQSGFVFARFVTPLNQAASLSRTHAWVAGGFDTQDGFATFQHTLDSSILLRSGQNIRTVTGNLQAGDNWAAPTYYIQEWIEDV